MMADGVDFLSLLTFLRDFGVPTIGVAAMGTAYRLGQKVGVIEKTLSDQKTWNAKTEERLDEQEESQSKLELKLAQLPTRDEVKEMIGDLRQDFRSFREGTSFRGGGKGY